MTKEQFISNEAARASENGGYKVDLNLINRCWDMASKEQVPESKDYVKPYYEDGVFNGVEVNVGGEHFLIAPHDLSDKERDWKDTMKFLEQTGNKTFTYKQICAVMMFREEINTILKENGGEPLGKWYWTCAEDSAYGAFYYYGYGGCLYGTDKFSTISCRAVLALDAPLETLPLNETDRLSDLEKKVAGLTEDMNKIKNLFK